MGTLLTTIFIQVCTIFQGILLAQMLGPSGRGDYFSVVLWPTLFAALGIFGVNVAIARFSAKNAISSKIRRTAAVAGMLTGTLTLVACALSLPHLLPQDKYYLLPACYAFLLFIPINHVALNLQAIDHGAANFKWLNITRGILYPIYFIGLTIVWAHAEDKVFWATVALLIANLSVISVRFLSREKSMAVGDEPPKLVHLVVSGFPFMLSNLIALVYMQADKAILVWLLPSTDVGIYVAGFAAAGTVNALSNSISIVQFSKSARGLSQSGFLELAVVIRRCGFISFLAGVGLYFLAPTLIPLIYGTEFESSISILQILISGVVFSGISEIINQSLRGQNQPTMPAVAKLVGLFMMAGTGWMLVAKHGAQGIAIGYVVGEITVLLSLLFICSRYYIDWNSFELLLARTDFLWAKEKIRLIKYKLIGGLFSI